MSKVEKYNKPNLIVAKKVVALVEKEVVPSAKYSSGGRDKKSDRNTNRMMSRREVATVVTWSDIYCVTILVNKNITTEGEKEKTSTQRRLTNRPDSPHPHLKKHSEKKARRKL